MPLGFGALLRLLYYYSFIISIYHKMQFFLSFLHWQKDAKFSFHTEKKRSKITTCFLKGKYDLTQSLNLSIGFVPSYLKYLPPWQ